MNKSVLFFFGLLLVLSASATAAEPSWQLQKDKNGIRVFTRSVEASPVLEFRAETEIHAPLGTVTSFYEQVERLTQWFYRCKEAQLLKEVSADESLVYFAADLPWPLSDRDGIYRRLKTVDTATGVVSYQLSAANDRYPAQEGRVRVEFLDAEWRFTPQPKGMTRVYYRMHTSAGGFIPVAIVNRFTVSLPFKTLRKLRSILESP